jgi:hypothetical protein
VEVSRGRKNAKLRWMDGVTAGVERKVLNIKDVKMCVHYGSSF